MAARGRRRSRPGKWVRRHPLGAALLLAVCATLAVPLTINLAVAFFGSTLVNPLSTTALEAKTSALRRYFEHRSRCLVSGGHGPLDPVVVAAARRHNVDRWLLHALIEVESGSRPHRISRLGAMGPAQLMPGTAAMLRVDDPFDPAQGIDGGARYLAEMLRRFRGDRTLAVAAYNAGPNSIVDGRVPRNGETEHYVVKVLARWNELRPQGEQRSGTARPAPAVAQP